MLGLMITGIVIGIKFAVTEPCTVEIEDPCGQCEAAGWMVTDPNARLRYNSINISGVENVSKN